MRLLVTLSDACKVLNVTRQTMMIWLEKGTFPGAQKGERRTDQWLIPVEEVEAKRLELLAELEESIRAISKPASMYRFNYVAQIQ